VDSEVCKNRLRARKNHPTIATVAQALELVDKFAFMLIPPSISEGFNDIERIGVNDDLDIIIQKYII